MLTFVAMLSQGGLTVNGQPAPVRPMATKQDSDRY
jgi:hypothetical protein